MKIQEVINGAYMPLHTVLPKSHLLEVKFPNQSIFFHVDVEGGTYSITNKFSGTRTSPNKKALHDSRSIIEFQQRLEDVTTISRAPDWRGRNQADIQMDERSIEIKEVTLGDPDITFDHLLYGFSWAAEF